MVLRQATRWCGATPLFLLFSACFLFFFYFSCSLCLSLYYLCLFIFRLCLFLLFVCGSPLLCGFSLFVLISLGLYLVGWINNLRWGEGKLNIKGSHASLAIILFFIYPQIHVSFIKIINLITKKKQIDPTTMPFHS
jgi:hypothetical protein